MRSVRERAVRSSNICDDVGNETPANIEKLFGLELLLLPLSLLALALALLLLPPERMVVCFVAAAARVVVVVLCVGKKYSRRKNDDAAACAAVAVAVARCCWRWLGLCLVGWLVGLLACLCLLAWLLLERVGAGWDSCWNNNECVSRARLIGFLFTLTPQYRACVIHARVYMCMCVCVCSTAVAASTAAAAVVLLRLLFFCTWGDFEYRFLPAFSDYVVEI